MSLGMPIGNGRCAAFPARVVDRAFGTVNWHRPGVVHSEAWTWTAGSTSASEKKRSNCGEAAVQFGCTEKVHITLIIVCDTSLTSRVQCS